MIHCDFTFKTIHETLICLSCDCFIPALLSRKDKSRGKLVIVETRISKQLVNCSSIMKHILLFLASAASSVLSLKIVNVSRNKIVRQGEDAVLFCQTDEPFDSCSWTLPTGVSCSSSQNQCRRAMNVHYNGTESNCQVLIKKVPDSLSGSWMCSVVKDGVTRNSTQVNLVEAQPAAVDWQGGVFGTFEVRWTTGGK